MFSLVFTLEVGGSDNNVALDGALILSGADGLNEGSTLFVNGRGGGGGAVVPRNGILMFSLVPMLEESGSLGAGDNNVALFFEVNFLFLANVDNFRTRAILDSRRDPEVELPLVFTGIATSGG